MTVSKSAASVNNPFGRFLFMILIHIYVSLSEDIRSICCRFFEAQPGLFISSSAMDQYGLWTVLPFQVKARSLDIKTTRLQQLW